MTATFWYMLSYFLVALSIAGVTLAVGYLISRLFSVADQRYDVDREPGVVRKYFPPSEYVLGLFALGALVLTYKIPSSILNRWFDYEPPFPISGPAAGSEMFWLVILTTLLLAVLIYGSAPVLRLVWRV